MTTAPTTSSKSYRRRAHRLNALYKKQLGLCLLCNNRLRRPTFEHIVPASQGGSNVDAHCEGGNVALSCRRCNQARGVAPLTPSQMQAVCIWYPRAARALGWAA